MAFTKKSIARSQPNPVQLPSAQPEIGDEKDGMVWDGAKWVPKAKPEAAD